MGLFRSDYMIHIDPENSLAQPELKQVEFNTIASSMGCLADKASQMHRQALCHGPINLAQPSEDDQVDTSVRSLHIQSLQ